MNMITVKHINKRFKNIQILKDVCFEAPKGKISGIIGRNGSGKTVFLKILCGLLYPDSGSVYIDGKEIGKDCDFPDSLGAIIEAPGFIPYQSGFKNLKYLASLKGNIGKEDISKSMKSVGLNPEDKKHVRKYSLGMKQRLGIAQAIMENPGVLILDEPMNGLDKEGVVEMRELFTNLKNEGKTIVLVSHNSEDITELCDYLYEIDNGEMKKINNFKNKY